MTQDELEELKLKYSLALKLLEAQLNVLIKEYEFKNKCNLVEHMKFRLKSEKSVLNKLKKKGYEVTIENLVNHIHDIIGIRIICSFISDVYEIVDIIKNSKQFLIKSEKDYINSPKDTGYISYHLLVLIPIVFKEKTELVEAEIQIRTLAMDFWASLDHKMQYKFTSELTDDIKQEIYDCSVMIHKLDRKMHSLNEKIKNKK